MKRIQLILLFTLSIFVTKQSIAQLILGPDTLCAENQLQLTTTVTNASTYYWGFCSAYLNNIPTGSSIAAGTGLSSPSSISMAKQGNNYFVFVVNTNAPRDIIRYHFGNSLSNVPFSHQLGRFLKWRTCKCQRF